MDLETSLALVNKPPIEEITHLNLVNKPPIDELYHHGILGMKWGIRRYQNPDGSLTPAGQRRLDRKTTKEENKRRKKEAKEQAKREKILKDPELLKKNIDKFTEEEVTRAMQNFAWQDKISEIKKHRSEENWRKADNVANKAIMVGNYANAAITFLNTPAGKELRNRLGFGTDDIGSFKTPEEVAATKRAIEKANLELRQQRANTAKSELDYSKANTQWEWDKADRHNKMFDEAMKRQTDAEDRANKRENDALSRERAKIQLEREKANWEDEKRNRAVNQTGSPASRPTDYSNQFRMTKSQINQDNLGKKTETRSETPNLGLPGPTSKPTTELYNPNKTVPNNDKDYYWEWDERLKKAVLRARHSAETENYIATNDFRAYSDYLMHYGVKGMKWGIRRYQDASGRLTAEGKEHYGKRSSASDTKEGIIIPVGLMVYAGMAVIGGAAIAIDSAVEAGKAHARNKRLYKDDNPNKITPENLKKVNPKWGDPQYSNNCTKCAATTELISRGISDYQAGKSNGGYSSKQYAKWFKGAKIKEVTSTETALRDHFDKLKSGNSGVLGLTYEGGFSGHAIHWTKLPDGDVRFEDGQVGKSYNLKEFMDTYKPASAVPCRVIRLDNCEPDYKKMREDEVIEPIEKKGGR